VTNFEGTEKGVSKHASRRAYAGGSPYYLPLPGGWAGRTGAKGCIRMHPGAAYGFYRRDTRYPISARPGPGFIFAKGLLPPRQAPPGVYIFLLRRIDPPDRPSPDGSNPNLPQGEDKAKQDARSRCPALPQSRGSTSTDAQDSRRQRSLRTTLMRSSTFVSLYEYAAKAIGMPKAEGNLHFVTFVISTNLPSLVS
jgi:hypothetical protein